MNAQDVLRDVHDPVNHALQTTGGGATIFAVVNTGAAGVQNSMTTIYPRVDYIGLMSVSGNVNVGTPTVFIGTPTLNAVVNIPSAVAINAGVNNIGFATVNISNPTIYAVVNTSAQSGQATVNINGSATIYAVVNTGASSDPKTYIGLVTAVNGLAWPDPKTFIGLATTVNGTSTANIGSVSVLGGSIGATLAASPSFIGIVTITNQPALVASTVNIGSVSVLGGSIGATLAASVNKIGFATVNLVNIPALVASTAFIGLATTVNGSSTANIGSVSILGGSIVNSAGVNFIGFATTVNTTSTANIGSVSILGGTIKNGGTTKTLVSLPVAMSTGSVATIAVPTTVNTMDITNLLLNSDATVRVNILSGVTYLNGNATIGTTLNPGGGWVETGAPDSPTYIGCPSGAIVIQKFDMTGTSAKVSGKIVYFQE